MTKSEVEKCDRHPDQRRVFVSDPEIPDQWVCASCLYEKWARLRDDLRSDPQLKDYPWPD